MRVAQEVRSPAQAESEKRTGKIRDVAQRSDVQDPASRLPKPVNPDGVRRSIAPSWPWPADPAQAHFEGCMSKCIWLLSGTVAHPSCPLPQCRKPLNSAGSRPLMSRPAGWPEARMANGPPCQLTAARPRSPQGGQVFSERACIISTRQAARRLGWPIVQGHGRVASFGQALQQLPRPAQFWRSSNAGQGAGGGDVAPTTSR